MNKALKLALSATAACIAAPVAAYAQNAFTTNDASMRAGPGVDYPRVAVIPEDSAVYIHGCLRGFNWCDVGWRGERGWVNGNLLSYSWGGQYVTVDEWGPRIGLPIISFEVRDYWTRYYRDRPWWERRGRWFEDDRRWRDRDVIRRDEWRRDEWRQEPRWQERQERWQERGQEQWRENRRDVTPDRSFQQREDWRQRQQQDRDERIQPRERTQERLQERSQEQRDRASERGQQMRERGFEQRERAQERGQQMRERAQERAQDRAQERQERQEQRQERRGQ